MRIACALLLVAEGCVGSSRPSRFYTLAPLEIRDRATALDVGTSLEVGPVEVPDYLDRAQIVTRTGANELVVAEFERWGGSLERDVGRALVTTLADRLASRHVVVSPWRSATLAPRDPRHRVAVTIWRFEGILGRSVLLCGRWELVAEGAGGPRTLAVRDATVTERIDGAGYDALVAAMQRALVRFGEEVADGFIGATQIASEP